MSSIPEKSSLEYQLSQCLQLISSIPKTRPNDGQSPQPIKSRESNESIGLEFGIKEFKHLENIIDDKFANILQKASTELFEEERVPESEPELKEKSSNQTKEESKENLKIEFKSMECIEDSENPIDSMLRLNYIPNSIFKDLSQLSSEHKFEKLLKYSVNRKPFNTWYFRGQFADNKKFICKLFNKELLAPSH